MAMVKNYTELNDAQAEAAVISTLLHHPEMILHSDFLRANMFYYNENGAIYWAIGELYKSGIDNIDAINLNNKLNSNGAVKKLMESKNMSDIQDLIDLSEYAVRNTVPEYLDLCKTVCSYSYKREMFKFSQELQRDCLSENVDLKKLDYNAHDQFSKLTEKYLISDEIQTIGELADGLMEDIIQRQTEDGNYGLPPKLEVFNERFQYEVGELVVVKARMKSGKSALLMVEALDKATNGIPTLYIDSEMDDRSFLIRMLASISKVQVRRIKEGRWSREEAQKIANAKDIIRNLPLVHRYMPVINEDEVYAMVRVLKYKMNLQFLIFDYIKDTASETSSLSLKLGARVDFLKNKIAGGEQIAVLAAAQLGRDGQAANSDMIDRYLSTSVIWRYKTGDEIKEDGGLEYGNVYARVDLSRNGAMQDEDEWSSVHFDGDTMTICDCKQPTKEEMPFD